MKNQKGITLIALVITIIVLLILAGVSIAMLSGENGILTQATKSKTETIKSEQIERTNLALDSCYSKILDGKLPTQAEDAPDTDYYTVNISGNIASNNVSVTITPKDSSISAGSISYDATSKSYKITPAK